ncbi:EVE domain-containing protein [Fuchsiella alkaliacetigena]|uniref:EVE domain-containing protein n=1 Tax=Fuchsiella alkaliacetigena TaxID=957042 RepID=UPI00200B7F6C|nr:EVE domain-containing protein [Fuchsiella alkaliacetigena]MCK8826067.1 EVE domain-containing protein [Fuchsiella alkaliacetigena]
MKDFTGYWTFFCNPKKWNIDDFLKSGEKYDTFTVRNWHKDDFEKGQLGIIRVGKDRRTKKELDGRKKLKSGVYAIVEILTKATLRKDDKPEYWNDDSLNEKRYRVDIKYIKNLINDPILLDDLKSENYNYDQHLIDGFQSSTMPLEYKSFRKIIDKVGYLEFNFANRDLNLKEDIEELEKEYSQAIPEVKKRLSKHIERGKISEKFKEVTKYKCQICDALGEDPYAFKKENGDFYIETHHIDPVSSLNKGCLGISNLITVCPNHHRQLHYGDVDILKNTDKELELKIDEDNITINKSDVISRYSKLLK